ncbi:putative Cystinosin like protein [Fusarium oxysporum f. sp. albedinis]|nr:putative Cystinosin like protein [Fusarium oxysporum f. sp. albedinis]
MAPSDTNNRATKPPASGSSSGDADLAQQQNNTMMAEMIVDIFVRFVYRLFDLTTKRHKQCSFCSPISIPFLNMPFIDSLSIPTPKSLDPACPWNAYRDLARGEQAATALENNLSNLESRLDAILAALEARETPQMPATAAKANSSPGAADKDQKGRSLDGANGDAEKIEKDAT